MKIEDVATVNAVVQMRERLRGAIMRLVEACPTGLRLTFDAADGGGEVFLHAGLDRDGHVLDMVSVFSNLSDAVESELRECLTLCNDKLAELGVEVGASVPAGTRPKGDVAMSMRVKAALNWLHNYNANLDIAEIAPNGDDFNRICDGVASILHGGIVPKIEITEEGR